MRHAMNCIKNFFAIILFGCLVAAVSGCNTTECDFTRPDGTKGHVSNTRIFWSSESYTISFSTNSASLTANNSNTDKAAISAAVDAAVTAAAKSIKP